MRLPLGRNQVEVLRCRGLGDATHVRVPAAGVLGAGVVSTYDGLALPFVMITLALIALVIASAARVSAFPSGDAEVARLEWAGRRARLPQGMEGPAEGASSTSRSEPTNRRATSG